MRCEKRANGWVDLLVGKIQKRGTIVKPGHSDFEVPRRHPLRLHANLIAIVRGIVAPATHKAGATIPRTSAHIDFQIKTICLSRQQNLKTLDESMRDGRHDGQLIVFQRWKILIGHIFVPNRS